MPNHLSKAESSENGNPNRFYGEAKKSFGVIYNDCSFLVILTAA